MTISPTQDLGALEIEFTDFAGHARITNFSLPDWKNTMKRIVLNPLALAASIALSASLSAHAGKIVLANDEWTLGNGGFTASSDPGIFAVNVADWFTGGGPGSFLFFSDNFGLTQSQLNSALTGAGHSRTLTINAATFTLANLQNYDGVFLAGNTPPGGLAAYSQVLTDYVNGGGNVYIAAGTGVSGASAEAGRWNTFLANFDLAFAPAYQGLGGDIAITSTHPIFAGVDRLYQNNGQNISDLDALDPQQRVLVSSNGRGLYAVYESAQVPEPSSLALGVAALLGLIGVRRRVA
jgi:hypothetical protein